MSFMFAYIGKVNGKRYFFGQGNTPRTARVVGQGNVEQVERAGFNVEHTAVLRTPDLIEAMGHESMPNFKELLK